VSSEYDLEMTGGIGSDGEEGDTLAFRDEIRETFGGDCLRVSRWVVDHVKGLEYGAEEGLATARKSEINFRPTEKSNSMA
jgi:hypothetical protein